MKKSQKFGNVKNKAAVDERKEISYDDAICNHPKENELTTYLNTALKEKIEKLKNINEQKSEAVEALRKQKWHLFCSVQSLTNKTYNSSHQMRRMLSSCNENLDIINSKRFASENKKQEQFKLMDSSLESLVEQLKVLKSWDAMSKSEIEQKIKYYEKETARLELEEELIIEKQMQQSQMIENHTTSSETNFWEELKIGQEKTYKQNQVIIDQYRRKIQIQKKRIAEKKSLQNASEVLALKQKSDELKNR